MDDAKFVETTLSSEEAFAGVLLKVRVDRVELPDGVRSVREYVRHPGAVMILAQTDDGRLVFERQYRHPIGRVFIELPAGKIDPGEEDLATAQRELREETGHEAAHWRHLGTLHPCIGYSDERIEIFLARELRYVGHALDHGEILETFTMPLEAALDAVFDGTITDGKTVAGLLWAQRALRPR